MLAAATAALEPAAWAPMLAAAAAVLEPALSAQMLAAAAAALELDPWTARRGLKLRSLRPQNCFQVWDRDCCGCVSCYMGAWRAQQFASWALRKVGSVEYVGRGGRMRYVPRNMRRRQGWIETATARMSAEGSARPVCLVCMCPFFVSIITAGSRYAGWFG